MIRKSWLRRGDRSPSKSPNKSISPLKSPDKLLLRMKCENSPGLNWLSIRKKTSESS